MVFWFGVLVWSFGLAFWSGVCSMPFLWCFSFGVLVQCFNTFFVCACMVFSYGVLVCCLLYGVFFVYGVFVRFLYGVLVRCFGVFFVWCLSMV